MREIKFRVWRGAPSHKDVMTYVNVSDECDWLNFGSDIVNICHDNKEGVVVMQYTGLKDKNGKEIYEGDVVRAIVKYTTSELMRLLKYETREVIGVVQWNDRGYWELKTQDEYLGVVGFYAVESFLDVLGNVYENPDCL